MAANKLEWVCPGCEAPNVIVPEPGKQYVLTCSQCGTPGALLQPKGPRVPTQDFTTSTAYTPAHLDYMRIIDG